MYADDLTDRSALTSTALLSVIGAKIYLRTVEWHDRGVDHWDWAATEPDDGGRNAVSYWTEKLNYHNYQIWHAEDHCRSGDPERILRFKPIIDLHNQLRNDCIERLDALFVAEQPDVGPGQYVSETLGSIIDRISITRLKLYHTMELDAGTLKYTSRIGVLCDQYMFLELQAAALMNDLRSGARKIRVFKQLKMYNSPETNPHHAARGAA